MTLLKATLADAGRALGRDHSVTELVRGNLAAALAADRPGGSPQAC